MPIQLHVHAPGPLNHRVPPDGIIERPHDNIRAVALPGFHAAVEIGHQMSQWVRMVVPPPVARPCTAAMRGLLKSISALISRFGADCLGDRAASSRSLPGRRRP